ncbi:MAG: NfeD family protein [Lachnospiraceae bacterium]|nr:NfeD family protein [Lachnospiraceae bacterium]MBQ9232547.1 NfeD family protein [Lachnospiraceae bacterium]
MTWMVIWLIATAVLVVMEIISLGLTTIWFAGGALVAALFAFLNFHWMVQILIFAIVSLLLLVFTRPVAVKHLMKEPEKTNVESLIGKIGYVTKTINNLKAEGEVKLNGMEWTARSKDDSVIEKDEKVVVDSISGVKLIVTKISDMAGNEGDDAAQKM